MVRHLTFANVCSLTALVVALGTGTAYAAATITSADIVNETIQTQDIKNGQVKSADLAGASVGAGELRPDSVDSSKVVSNSLTALDLATGSVGTVEIENGSIYGADVAPSSLTGDHIATNSISLSDIVGADASGVIGTGAIADGRCAQIQVTVNGAQAGQGALITFAGSVPPGITFTATRTLTNAVVGTVCNLTGAAYGGLPSVPVRIITFG